MDHIVNSVWKVICHDLLKRLVLRERATSWETIIAPVDESSMVHHPLFTLPSSAAAEALAGEVSDYGTHGQVQHFVKTSGLKGNDSRLLVVAAATNSAAFFPLLAQGANGPLANFKAGDSASSIVQYCGQLPMWFREFIHYGLTAGDIIAVLAARSSKRNAMRVLSHAEQLGVTAFGAALVPRSVMDHTEFGHPTVSDALDILAKLALPPEYHSVAVGALLRSRIVFLSNYAVLQIVANYMESRGIARAPALEMYAALCRRDTHALISCSGLPVALGGLMVYGTGDTPSDSSTAKALKEEFIAANNSHVHLRAVAIAERLQTDTWAYARIAHYALHTSTVSPIDALALVLDLAKTSLTEDETIVFLKRALTNDIFVSSVALLVEHSGYRPHILAQALVMHISLRMFHSVDSAHLYAARLAAATPADGSASAPARRQASLHRACQAINDACALGLAMDDDSFTGGADLLFVLLIRAIDSTSYRGLGAIFAHPKFRGTLGFQHAVHRACTHTISLKSPDALLNVLTACQSHGIVATLCDLIVTVSSYFYELHYLQCVTSFFPGQAQRGRHTKNRLASALRDAVRVNEYACAWDRMTCLAKTADLCKIDIHAEVINVLSQTTILYRFLTAKTIANIFPFFGEHAHAVAIAAYRRAAEKFYKHTDVLLSLRGACLPIPLADRLTWEVDPSNWRTVFPEMTDNDVAELFIERCKLSRLQGDWVASAVQDVRLRVSQRKRVIAARRAQCFRELLSVGNDHFDVVSSARFPSDGATCPLCFEDIDAADAGASDPLAAYTSMTTVPPAVSDSALCNCDWLEPKKGSKLLPSIFDLRPEADKILANVATDLAPVAAKYPGRHLAHRECLRAWFSRRKVCPVCSFPL